MLTQEEALMLFSYDPDTGIVTRLVSVSGRGIAGDVVSNKGTHGYIRTGFQGGRIDLHRVIWLMVYGYFPSQIDHINGIRDDNRLVNLREVTPQDNSRNRKLPANNNSGCVGVSKSQFGKWRSRITVNHKQIFLGEFTDINEAVSARKSAENEYGFHQNHGRKG